MRAKGFTLIETLVALGLVSFLIAGTAEMIGLALLTRRKAEACIEATRLLADKLERLRSLPFAHAGLEAGEYRETFEAAEKGGAYVMEWTVSDLPGRMKRVGIKVAGPARGTAEAALLLSGRLGFAP
jgi:prepilin-type N-terminal cleavage/methylation domain-containing protein